MNDLAALLSLAESSAREAGDMLRDAFQAGQHKTTTKSSPTDLVSESDYAAERIIRGALSRARPDDAVLGEEEGDVAGTSGLRWVVDPLDGTINFLYGIPMWAVSIACEDENGKALVGVVFDPMRDELWSARADGQPRLNGEPVTPSGCTQLDQALVATGFGYAADVRAIQAGVIAELLPHVRDLRRLGAAALDLSWTAAGRLDAYFERGVKHWDMAAGALLCERAGLSVRTIPALGAAPQGLLVSAPEMADDLQSHLG